LTLTKKPQNRNGRENAIPVLIGNFGAKEAVAPVDEFHQLCDSLIKIFSQTFTLLFNRNA